MFNVGDRIYVIIFHLLHFQQIQYLTCLGAIHRMHPPGETIQQFGVWNSFPPGAKPWPNFWVKLDLGIRNSRVLFPGSGRLPFSLKMAPKFCPNFTFCHFLQLELINFCCHCHGYKHLIGIDIIMQLRWYHRIFHILDIYVWLHIPIQLLYLITSVCIIRWFYNS